MTPKRPGWSPARAFLSLNALTYHQERSSSVYAMTPWVSRLLLANVAMYFVTQASPMTYRLLMFVPAETLIRPWGVFTYMFLHANFTHLLFNMLGLFFFGPRLEMRLGSGGFLKLYFLSDSQISLLREISPGPP